MVIWQEHNHIGDNMSKDLIPENVTAPFSFNNLSRIIRYDRETNTIIIDNETQLNIAFSGPIRLVSNDDIEIETNGQFDVVTHGQTICLDSLQSRLFLNSRRSKHCMRKADRFEGATRKITDDKGSNRDRYDQLYVSQLEELVYKLTDRVDKLENNLKSIEEK